MTPQKMENAIAFIIEQQAKFEDNFTRAERRYGEADKHFARVEKRLDRLEELAQSSEEPDRLGALAKVCP